MLVSTVIAVAFKIFRTSLTESFLQCDNEQCYGYLDHTPREVTVKNILGTNQVTQIEHLKIDVSDHKEEGMSDEEGGDKEDGSDVEDGDSQEFSS